MRPTAVVTGTAGAIGGAIATTLTDKGYSVVGIDIVETVHTGVERVYPCDLAELNALEPLLHRIEAEVGPVDVLVNNAAYVTASPLAELTPEEIMRTLTVNVAAVMLLARAAAERMAKRGKGAIVNMSSVAGQRGSSQAAYGASKAAVINLTRTMARHYAASGVRINAVAPGFVDAGMGERLPEPVRAGLLQATAMGRGGTPQEIAEVVAFLASDAASFMTAETVGVHGGI